MSEPEPTQPETQPAPPQAPTPAPASEPAPTIKVPKFRTGPNVEWRNPGYGIPDIGLPETEPEAKPPNDA